MPMQAIRVMLSAGCVLCVLALGALAVDAHPKPSLVPKSWDLDVTFKTPEPISVRAKDGTTKWYWYMQYKVVNNTGQERFFSPEIQIATDKGDLVTANDDIPAGVFEAINRKLENPLLEHPLNIVGKILVGEDYARNTVAIWPAFDHDVDRVQVFMAGMSGETATINDPVSGEKIVLRKTLQIDYETPGTDVHPQRQPFVAKGHTWIMR